MLFPTTAKHISTRAVHPRNVPQHFLHVLMCDWGPDQRCPPSDQSWVVKERSHCHVQSWLLILMRLIFNQCSLICLLTSDQVDWEQRELLSFWDLSGSWHPPVLHYPHLLDFPFLHSGITVPCVRERHLPERNSMWTLKGYSRSWPGTMSAGGFISQGLCRKQSTAATCLLNDFIHLRTDGRIEDLGICSHQMHQ